MKPILALVGVASLVAALVWARSTRRLHVVWRRVEAERGRDADVTVLARSAFRKDLHTTCLYGALAVAAGGVVVAGERIPSLLFLLILVPVALSVAYGRDFARETRLAEDRTTIERKAEEILSREELAPKRGAARLAPEELPDFAGFELGRVYQAGTGVMAGDFYDVFRVGPSRIAAVIGDVTGRGIEASITAFQAKYLLRVFLRQYRDPAQALEELNTQMAAPDRIEEFISLVVVLFDTNGSYHSREIRLDVGDLLLLYTDGLAEVRNGEQIFGEERIANAVRRDPNVAAGVLCKNLLETARDFASESMGDDLAKGAEKLAAQGKLFVRDRLALLLDADSFVEDGLLANNQATDLPADGVVTGVGRIEGRPVCVMANDPTVKAGSWGARTVEKIVRLTEHALKHELPVVYLVDSAGARITDQVELFPGRRGAGRIFANQVRLSGRVPQVCCLFGHSAAGGAYIPSFCDVVLMVEGNATMYLGSPRMAEEVIGEKVTLEEMGGARIHAEVSGVGDMVVA